MRWRVSLPSSFCRFGAVCHECLAAAHQRAISDGYGCVSRTGKVALADAHFRRRSNLAARMRSPIQSRLTVDRVVVVADAMQPGAALPMVEPW